MKCVTRLVKSVLQVGETIDSELTHLRPAGGSLSQPLPSLLAPPTQMR